MPYIGAYPDCSRYMSESEIKEQSINGQCDVLSPPEFYIINNEKFENCGLEYKDLSHELSETLRRTYACC